MAIRLALGFGNLRSLQGETAWCPAHDPTRVEEQVIVPIAPKAPPSCASLSPASSVGTHHVAKAPPMGLGPPPKSVDVVSSAQSVAESPLAGTSLAVNSVRVVGELGRSGGHCEE